MSEGFDLKTASAILRKTARIMGIGSGLWRPVGDIGTAFDVPAETVIAVVWNSKKLIEITAGDVQYVHQYLS